MSPEDSFNNILTLPKVKGFAFVSSEDGSAIKRGGETPGNMDEIVAFIGSAAEIISESCSIKEFKCIKVIGLDNLVIIPYQHNYLGFIIDEDEKNIEKKIINKLIEEEGKAEIIINKLLKTKLSQLNMLIDEFVKGGDRLIWHDYVSKGVTALSKGSKIENCISIEDAKLITTNSKDLTREEINKFMKLLLDFIVKKAVSEYGSDEAKRRVHAVIKRMSNK